MGRESYSYCETCNVYQYNGYGSGITWMDWYQTVEEFDAALAGQPLESKRNQNVRAFLVRHAGHDIGHTSGDHYSDTDPDLLAGKTEEKAPNPDP